MFVDSKFPQSQYLIYKQFHFKILLQIQYKNREKKTKSYNGGNEIGMVLTIIK